MNVWNEIGRAYEIQKELIALPPVRVKKRSRQARWLLESEKLALLISIEQEKEMSNWWEKILIGLALWGLTEPFVVEKVKMLTKK